MELRRPRAAKALAGLLGAVAAAQLVLGGPALAVQPFLSSTGASSLYWRGRKGSFCLTQGSCPGILVVTEACCGSLLWCLRYLVLCLQNFHSMLHVP